MVAGGLLFVAVTVLVRHLGSDMPAVEAAFIRYLIGVLLLLPVLVLLPLGLTALLTLAVIEITPVTLNMANILVIPLIFGLGVDTGIHVVPALVVSLTPPEAAVAK